MPQRHCLSRRHLLRCTLRGAAAGAILGAWPRAARSAAPAADRTRVAFTHGDSRADNILQALKRIEDQIRQGIARKKTVILKPNMVSVNRQLSATHVDCLEAILDFLSPMVKDEIIIPESPAGGPATEGFSNYGYTRLAGKYKVRFVDLDESPTVIRQVIDHRYRAVPVRFAELMLNPDAYVISAAVFKTHDRAVTTLSLKNIVVGAAIKDRTFKWGAGGKGSNDKIVIHGGPENQGINYNLFALSRILRPDLAVLDGFEGMQRNGPVSGEPVDHRVAVASTDWLAADRVAVELMGIDFSKVGYLAFAAEAGRGQADLGKIEILGDALAGHVRKYRLHDNIEKQYQWMSRS